MREGGRDEKKFLVFLVLAGIMFLTLQTPEQTHAVSSEAQVLLLQFIDAPWIRNMVTLRRVLHAPLYFVLGVAAAIWQNKWYKAAGICAFAALADETLKIFLPTREFGKEDLLFDAIGFMTGILFMFVLRYVRERSKVKR